MMGSTSDYEKKEKRSFPVREGSGPARPITGAIPFTDGYKYGKSAKAVRVRVRCTCDMPTWAVEAGAKAGMEFSGGGQRGVGTADRAENRCR